MSEWISAEDRMPDDGETVIVVWINRKPAPYYMYLKDKPFTAPALRWKGKWYWWSVTCEDLLKEYDKDEYDKVNKGIEITHWMPMPETPKENANENS